MNAIASSSPRLSARACVVMGTLTAAAAPARHALLRVAKFRVPVDRVGAEAQAARRNHDAARAQLAVVLRLKVLRAKRARQLPMQMG